MRVFKFVSLVIATIVVCDAFSQAEIQGSIGRSRDDDVFARCIQNNILQNGIVYRFSYAGAIGTPFYKDGITAKGAIRVQGNWINNLSVCLDLINQDLILNLENSRWGKQKVVVRKELVEQVVIGDKTFIYCDELEAYVERIASQKDLMLMRTYNKILRISQSEGKMEIRSTKPKLFIKTDSAVIRLRHNRDFKKLVMPENYSKINEQLHRSGFRIKSPNEKSGQDLLNTIAKLR